MNRALLSSKRHDWTTPQDFFDELNKMRWIKQGTCSVGLTISRYLGRLRSSKTMITREVN